MRTDPEVERAMNYLLSTTDLDRTRHALETTIKLRQDKAPVLAQECKELDVLVDIALEDPSEFKAFKLTVDALRKAMSKQEMFGPLKFPDKFVYEKKDLQKDLFNRALMGLHLMTLKRVRNGMPALKQQIEFIFLIKSAKEMHTELCELAWQTGGLEPDEHYEELIKKEIDQYWKRVDAQLAKAYTLALCPNFDSK